MKIIIAVAGIIAVTNALSAVTEEHWQSFKKNFTKTFFDPNEESTRFSIFQENFRKIQAHNELYNRGKVSYFLKINQFSDRSIEEMKQLFTVDIGNYQTIGGTKYQRDPDATAPDAIDWRNLGAVTGIKDQGYCASCWSFSATGSLEGQFFKKTGHLTSLSEQNLVDCSFSYGNEGCQGGLMDSAFAYVRDFGIMSEDSYAYEGYDEVCKYNTTNRVLAIKSYVDLEIGNEEILKEAVATIGPISVAIDAGSDVFPAYGGGVFDYKYCGNLRFSLDHGVLVVGYGTSEDGLEYWLVKNSWGTSWGEDGYIRMSRNKDNQCGIATLASYPVL